MQIFEKKELKKRSDNLSDWYTDVILKAELADYAPVKGTMVIRPYGYALWEAVQEIFNRMMRTRGVENAYFPLFIPHSLLEKEKEHVEGFSPQLALVTIGGGEKLKDPLVVRPTSETIMYAMYAKWVHSWRDLPILINQWNNVVRWEKRTYLFLRTTEFLWQEGHTAHETEKKAIEMALAAFEWYRQVFEDYLAIPVYQGIKSAAEKFAGAKTTYTNEALMPDGKALQSATSHNLGQNFSKVFDIQFAGRDGKMEYVWQTSWGLSTRVLGGLFLTHGDDNGIILPPKIAPIQVVIVPIESKHVKKNALQSARDLFLYIEPLKKELEGKGIRIRVDSSVESLGRKFNKWELKGVPLRFEIGDTEVDSNIIKVARRDTFEKFNIQRSDIVAYTERLLVEIQKSLFEKAKKFRDDNTRDAATYDEFKKIMSSTRGFIRAFWCEDAACEAAIKEETKASTRCLPLNSRPGLEHEASGVCVRCGKPASHRWLFAQSY
ncbi:proline--tRNA ligase [Patescibacteria group bacterium]|nr:proline--tRNA ligase [Patescibacteria group bacterium]MBU1472897.1 proline--tRNA ligase [Patescibacteria group bacterium]MBU2459798.1 proline--tRNA ligase [Patescibacteria group bacterium]MBU2544819.1 proline--tRNA ligase [Patescibacteria group bacterium]